MNESLQDAVLEPNCQNGVSTKFRYIDMAEQLSGEIRAALDEMGFRETRDYACAA